MAFTVILPENEMSGALLRELQVALQGMDYTVQNHIRGAKGKLLFALALDECGCNDNYYFMLREIRKDRASLLGCTAGIIVTSCCEFYTKATARVLVGSANASGCAFIGRPLVEGTGSLRNFHTQAQVQGTDVKGAYRAAIRELAQRLEAWQGPSPIRKIVAVHASLRETSNTLSLWSLIKRHLHSAEIREFSLVDGGNIADCSGCSYTACMHFGQKGSCLHGGDVVVKDIFPALREADALVMLCANYNDTLSANLTAFINRLTVLFRQARFYDKQLFGVVVSGYSGGDLLARQLISALNMNKSFYLPPYFDILETANEAGSLLKMEGIEERAESYARRMLGRE